MIIMSTTIAAVAIYVDFIFLYLFLSELNTAKVIIWVPAIIFIAYIDTVCIQQDSRQVWNSTKRWQI